MTRKYKNGNGKHYKKRPQYLAIGSTVYTHVTCGTRNKKKMYLCEARIIRHPNFQGGPYKLLITGIQLPNDKSMIPQGILELRLRRPDSGIIRSLNAFTNITGEHWIRLEQEKSDTLLKRAISFIKKEKRLKKRSWPNEIRSKKR